MLLEIDVLSAVRIPSTLLKPAALLLLGASTVLGCSGANALNLQTYDLTYLANNNSSSNTLSGSFTIDTDSATSFLGFTSLPGWLTAVSLTETTADGAVTYTLTDFTGFAFDFTGTPNYNADLVGQISDINFFSSTVPLSGISPNELLSNADVYVLQSASPQAAAVPAPLPILGLPAVLFYSRKLKKRIKASREIASNDVA